MTFNNPVVGGEGGELIRASIKSPDFAAGVRGWIIRRDGSAEFNNVTIRFELATGSIIVGPAGSPQVFIGSTVNHGFIKFPTNESFETSPAQIYADKATTTDTVQLHIDSGTTEAGLGDSAGITLSSAEDGVANDEKIDLRANLAHIQLHDGLILLDSNDVEVTNEILVASSESDVNYPERVARGKVFTGTTDTTISAVSDTLVTDANTDTAYLEAGVAYEVDIQIPTRSSVGTSASGTQAIMWKIWDGAVGGTQLANTLRKVTDSVGSSFSITSFKFVFEHTGSTGTRTINLSAFQTAGTDTLQARVNTQYYMLVKRIGDPAQIINL